MASERLPALTEQPEVAAELGLLGPDLDRAPLVERWDRRTKEDGYLGDPIDLGWCGEDENGIWMTCEPYSALLGMPELWRPWIAFQAGQRELTSEDFEQLSAFEYDCKVVMIGADIRSQRRRMRKPSDDGDQG